MIKFGKKAQDILSIKKNFLLENKKLFSWQKKLFKIYNNQPKRKFCKNCEHKLAGSKFRKLNQKFFLGIQQRSVQINFAINFTFRFHS